VCLSWQSCRPQKQMSFLLVMTSRGTTYRTSITILNELQETSKINCKNHPKWTSRNIQNELQETSKMNFNNHPKWISVRYYYKKTFFHFGCFLKFILDVSWSSFWMFLEVHFGRFLQFIFGWFFKSFRMVHDIYFWWLLRNNSWNSFRMVLKSSFGIVLFIHLSLLLFLRVQYQMVVLNDIDT